MDSIIHSHALTRLMHFTQKSYQNHCPFYTFHIPDFTPASVSVPSKKQVLNTLTLFLPHLFWPFHSSSKSNMNSKICSIISYHNTLYILPSQYIKISYTYIKFLLIILPCSFRSSRWTLIAVRKMNLITILFSFFLLLTLLFWYHAACLF